jgi:hypothetical protein
MEIPEWVKKYRQKGTAIEAHGGNYYLRRVSSKWDKEKQRARKISGEYLGKITRDGLIPPKREQVRKSLTSENITVREFGATQFILNCNEDIISRQEVASQIAKYAAPSIWGNPTVTCVGSNAGVWSLQDNMEMLEVLSNQTVRIKIP